LSIHKYKAFSIVLYTYIFNDLQKMVSNNVPFVVTDMRGFMEKIPEFELSYETISHKKVSDKYDLALAIPYGKKYVIWFTYYREHDVLYVMELNRERKVVGATRFPAPKAPASLAHGTMLYGTLLEKRQGFSANGGMTGNGFIIEDILWCQGISMKRVVSQMDKLLFLEKIMPMLQPITDPFAFYLPMMWCMDHDAPAAIPPAITAVMAYPLHHIQFRSSQCQIRDFQRRS